MTMAAVPNHLTRSAMARMLGEGLTELESEAAALSERPVSSSAEFEVFEKDAAAFGAKVADRLVQEKIMAAHVGETERKLACKEARARLVAEGESRRIDNLGPRPASVRLAGGALFRLETPYLRPSRKGLIGRPRTKRGPDGSGCYPVLEKLGIRDGVTPLTRSKLCRQIVQCGSYAEALDQLHSDGLDVDVSTMVRVAVSTGSEAIERRNEALARALAEPLPKQSLVEGRRLRVSVDGGRARTRKTHTKHRKKSNGRRAFDVPWREPRLITVDLLTEEGVIDPAVPPIYEVDLGKADDIFDILAGLLRLIGAHRAKEVVFVADGADWIWDRIDELIQRAELDPERVHKILDFYHASEHISDALKACKDLSEQERKSLHASLNRQLLEDGGVQAVIQRLTELARGRRAKQISKEIRYLEKHVDHMRYAAWRAAKVPIGSGIVESAIRRVINLRFKAASTYWREDHLAALLYLRCALKSGRWDEFMAANLRGEHWLKPGGNKDTSAVLEAA